VINCQLQGRAFIFDKGESRNAVVDGFAIVNGQASAGGAIYCENASPTVANCLIHYCSALASPPRPREEGSTARGVLPWSSTASSCRTRPEAASRRARAGVGEASSWAVTVRP